MHIIIFHKSAVHPNRYYLEVSLNTLETASYFASYLTKDDCKKLAQQLKDEGF